MGHRLPGFSSSSSSSSFSSGRVVAPIAERGIALLGRWVGAEPAHHGRNVAFAGAWCVDSGPCSGWGTYLAIY